MSNELWYKLNEAEMEQHSAWLKAQFKNGMLRQYESVYYLKGGSFLHKYYAYLCHSATKSTSLNLYSKSDTPVYIQNNSKTAQLADRIKKILKGNQKSLASWELPENADPFLKREWTMIRDWLCLV